MAISIDLHLCDTPLPRIEGDETSHAGAAEAGCSRLTRRCLPLSRKPETEEDLLGLGCRFDSNVWIAGIGNTHQPNRTSLFHHESGNLLEKVRDLIGILQPEVVALHCGLEQVGVLGA